MSLQGEDLAGVTVSDGPKLARILEKADNSHYIFCWWGPCRGVTFTEACPFRRTVTLALPRCGDESVRVRVANVRGGFGGVVRSSCIPSLHPFVVPIGKSRRLIFCFGFLFGHDGMPRGWGS